MPERPQGQDPNRRKYRRAKMAQSMRVRPSEPRDAHFEDLPVSVNASREGVYFTSRRDGYYAGMRVFVTFPFTSPNEPMNCEYIGQVVRVEKLPNSRFGVAVHLLMTLNYGGVAAGARPVNTR